MSSLSSSPSSCNNDKKTITAKIVSIDTLPDCGSRLRDGHLVSFPTETVYGLGCHALSKDAILKVFAAKERPLTDPLIVHLLGTPDALPLWDPHNHPILRLLTDRFWPGPLTLVAKASPGVPGVVMADTGFVACRSPSHPIARALLAEANIPIAAPSANKFGHVSPTQAQHVYDDLKYEDVWIIETPPPSPQNQTTPMSCQVGVESTVAKLEHDTITVLRHGAVSVQDIHSCLKHAGYDQIRVTASTKHATDQTVPHVAPGQTLRHYSPDIPSFMLGTEFDVEGCCSSANQQQQQQSLLLQNSVVLDFGGRLAKWKDTALSYYDLSPTKDSKQAAQTVFERLRWAEQVEGAKRIYFPALVRTAQQQLDEEDALLLAVQDRLTRAANGVIINRLQDL
eukprot:CAMPEP_0202476418 /NCGR_PEP_ID=MMETSP1360-20130828/93415_1 /ASSEMBLY_ACC=CAM_ASM_000848 /TAXON_ID=515479 /ORGANISM="Licmophora paradoxa, Strain CCMP2313" /LENGTH=395 /DNA_ID=CAMNT_0049103625 /DNA_START=97 /DNA_END=1284 /DNA_ORIENTATION=-